MAGDGVGIQDAQAPRVVSELLRAAVAVGFARRLGRGFNFRVCAVALVARHAHQFERPAARLLDLYVLERWDIFHARLRRYRAAIGSRAIHRSYGSRNWL